MTAKKKEETKKEEKKSSLQRASERIKIATTSAVTNAVSSALEPKKVKSALAFKLIVVGLTLTALAGGFDYFSHDDEIHKAVANFARDAQYDGVANAVETFDGKVNEIKTGTLDSLPKTFRDHLAGAALAAGIVMLFAGVRMKIKEHHPVHANVLRDVGRAIAGPGYVGVGVFVVLSYQGALIVRRSFANLHHKLSSGELTWGDAFGLVPHYAPWAYADVGTFLWLGVILGVFAVAAKIAEGRVEPLRAIPLQVARRTAAWASVLSLVFFGSAVLVAAISYGGALPVVTWPWKIDPGAFLAALVFMSFGMGLDRTGTRMLKREAEEQEAEGGKKA
jgi:hypothetical protein